MGSEKQRPFLNCRETVTAALLGLHSLLAGYEKGGSSPWAKECAWPVVAGEAETHFTLEPPKRKAGLPTLLFAKWDQCHFIV